MQSLKVLHPAYISQIPGRLPAEQRNKTDVEHGRKKRIEREDAGTLKLYVQGRVTM